MCVTYSFWYLNIHETPFSSPQFSILDHCHTVHITLLHTKSLLPPILYRLLRLLFTSHHCLLSPVYPSAASSSQLLIPVALYPLHGTISVITALYAISGLWRIYAPFSTVVPGLRRVLDLMTASDILALTKPHIYEYSRFRLLLRIKAKRLCVTTTPIPGMMSVDYTI